MKTPNTRDLVMGTGVAALVLLIGILIDRALDFLDIQIVIIGVILSLVIIFGIVAIIWALGRNSHEAELRRIIINLQDLSPSAKYDWLWTAEDMIKLEKSIKCKNIWICSPDLSYDTGTPDFDFENILHGNLKRDIIYTYIVPETEEIRAVLPHLNQIFSSFPNQLKVVLIPRTAFDSLSLAHTSIYDPEMELGDTPGVFIEIPIEVRGHGKGLWIKAASDISYKVVGRIRNIIEEE